MLDNPIHQAPGTPNDGMPEITLAIPALFYLGTQTLIAIAFAAASARFSWTPLGTICTVICLIFWTALCSSTMYGELSNAQGDEDFQRVRVRLKQEWTAIGALLVGCAAIDVTILAISPESVFKIRSYAYLAVATSSITSGLGILCTVWFLLRYPWVDIQTFIIRSRDVYGSYVFFSLSSRVPAFCTLISSASLMVFLGLVAYDIWPKGVLVLGITVVIGMCFQFLIYYSQRCAAHVTVEGYMLAVHTAQGFLGTAENV